MKETGVLDYLDTAGFLVVVSALLVGLYGASQSFGEVSSVVQRAIDQPLTFGVSFIFYGISLDVWTPAFSPQFLNDNWLGFLSILYWYSGGYVPMFSIWAFAFSLILCAIVTLGYLYFCEADFFFHGLAVAIVAFFVAWYVFTGLAWWGMFYFGGQLGLSSSTVYDIWHGAVSSTSSPLLTLFFIVTSVFGAIWSGRKIGGIIV